MGRGGDGSDREGKMTPLLGWLKDVALCCSSELISDSF